MRAINNSIIDRSCKNSTSTERVNTNNVSKPFNVISDCIVTLYDMDSKATPSQVKTLKAYRSIFTDAAVYSFTRTGMITASNSTHNYLIGKGGGVTCNWMLVDGKWKFVG
jgi:hypothetical protein